MISIDTILAGLNQGEFFLEYLPTVSLADGRCTGAEALVRWRRPTGVVQPMDFIPLAENTAMSGLISYWVFDRVLSEMKGWLATNSNAHISINVPPEILGRGGLLYTAIKSGLIKFASQLILEITERGVPDMIGVDALNSIKKVGDIRLALDDVTLVGNANLAILGRANFDIIKLDRSLLTQIDPQCPYPDWLNGITALVQSSQMVVIAEGIETKQQLMTLRKAGIQEAQGFYFSPPLPAERFIAYHREVCNSMPN